MAQLTHFADLDALALHQQTFDYGKILIVERKNQGPALDTIPPAWTPYRAHLSEALDYVTPGEPTECISDGLVVACIVDENCGDRTYLDSEIAIFQICTSISAAYGAKAYVAKRDYVVGCWERTMKSAASLVLIQTPGFPSKTVELSDPTHYVVLDHFRVSLIWTEGHEDGEHVHFVRLEKCNLQSRSWWTPRQPDPPARREYLGHHGPFCSPACNGCGKQSPRVYKEAAICLNKDCPYFCTPTSSESSGEPVPGELTFDDGFLLYRSHVNSAQRPPFPLVRNPLSDLNSLTASALSYSKMLLRGIVCARCKAIVPKVYWHVWRCEVCPPDVSRDYACDPGHIDLEAIVPRTFVSYNGHPPLNFSVPKDFGQEIPKQYKDYYMVDRWFLHDQSQLIVLSPTHLFNEYANGPNMVFTNILKDANSGALRLHRYKEQEPPVLDDHYQSNWGAEYGYRGLQDSLPFQQAPMSVAVARALLDEVGQGELRNYSNSNAVQVLGFMQGQGLQWHTDGEGELGETQSMLNLGGNAVFRLRLQQHHYNNETAFADGGEVVCGAKNWEKAIKIKALAAQGRRPTESDLSEFSHGQANAAQPEARIPLIHGSIVIMQGKSFGNFYEHSLETSGPLTFGVVTRSIDDNLHQELLTKKYAVATERPNGPLFTRSVEDPGETDRSPFPEPSTPIPIVVQHVRPRPDPIQRLAVPQSQHAHRRSPSTESTGSVASGSVASGSVASDTSSTNRERLPRLLFLKDHERLKYNEIQDQEGWHDWSETAMGSALKRYRDKLRWEGTYTSPTPSTSSGASRPRKSPQPASEASASGEKWPQQERDELWDFRHQNPPLTYDEIAQIKGGRRTAKACREQMHLEYERRGVMPPKKLKKGGTTGVGLRPTTRQRRATLTKTRERAASRGDGVGQRKLDLDVVQPVPALPAIRPVLVEQQSGENAEASGSGGGHHEGSAEEDDDEDHDFEVMRVAERKTSKGQRSR